MFLTGARSNYKLLPKPTAPAPVHSGLRAELMPPGPVSIAMDRGATASTSRSAARSPMRTTGKQSGSHEKPMKLESTTARPNIFSVKGRRVALTTRPTPEPRHELILPPIIKGKPSLVSKPTRNEDASRKEFCLTDTVSCSNQKICFPSMTKRLKPPIPKSERKEDGPGKRRTVLTSCPTKESRQEKVLPTGKRGRSSLVSMPIKKKDAHPGHVPHPPSATKGKVSHATKPTTKQEAPEVKVSPHINSVRPSNLREEKMKFFQSQFTYNPQFQYSTPDPPSVPLEYRTASGEFLNLAIAIIEKTLNRYGSYERFQDNAGGRPLQEHEIAKAVQRHLQKEGCSGEMKVCITKDALCIASMAIVNGRGKLTINASTARERWLEGTLCHEIGTHYYRSMNNMKQPWWQEREKYGMRPVNPTEEGFATLNTVLLRDDLFYSTLPSCTMRPTRRAACPSASSSRISALTSRPPTRCGTFA
uniref:Uncharacterized protein n=1 Tax=Leptobrachium leishanense TaxID=445787 RepID=A0A8C5RA19_9ANUR